MTGGARLYRSADWRRSIEQPRTETAARPSRGRGTLEARDVPRIRALMQYADRPMDPADAALVRVAERDGYQTVLTIDRADFGVYRPHGTRRFRVVP